ncbi:RagB/SusD family nutrient uptake outer membrane protein [Carboxylicivirga sediminis]|uniref:RagB/SusD family nutrient uptake outer membrane protein n=1 Tax=Carboxylicivirga sediminis TaxID=2006564 RepID=A0A941IXW9_9BACT|nr:RagB/SusD family nutrient uptake outer membrane protein [Carboxylicivirga sediminis]MBR8535948.1 RagB/SusD family nutrient uptake outer membrane protein [Carboxylicivirga sediminis]
MKNIALYIILFASSLMMVSCEDYLTQESPDKPTTDQVWVSYEAAESYLVSAYSYLAPTGWRYHEYYYLPQNFRGDDMFPEGGTTSWSYLGRIVGFNNTAADGVPAYMWRNWYKGVKLANDVIANVPNMDMLTQEQRDELVAEAKFLRGFYFLNLQMNFHSIIMPLEVATSPADLQIPVTPVEGVYAQVEEDLTFAAKHLPASWSDDNYGRATSNAAYAFLGKTYLFAEQYLDAIDAFAEIKGHDLVSGEDYRGLFDGTNEQNEEVLFSRGYTADQMDILYLYHQLGVAMAPAELNGGWFMASISDYFMSQLEDGDIRKAATVLQDGETFDGEVIHFDDPDFKMSIKYVESLNAISTNRSVVDLILMRYADVVLMEAEAYYELGKDGEALDKVNDIRFRAGLGDVNLSGTTLRDEIRKQRMIELVGENSRYYDLVRWDIVKEQLSNAGQPFAQNFETKHKFFPIPLEEVQRNSQVEPTPGF